MPTCRRDFLKTSVGCVLGMTLGPSLAFAADSPGAIPIGFQLYPVRGEFARNVPGTLKTLAQIGYKAVEFWGYGGTPNVYDVGNCLSGDGDPVAMLKEFPGRTRSIHLKEHQDKTFASDFYKGIFHLCETRCGTQWYIVEMGGLLGNGFDVPREAFAKLHRLGKG